MSKSLKSLASKRFLIIAAVVVMVVVLARPFDHYAHSRALGAVSRGNSQSDSHRALVWYRTAYLLAPHDPVVLKKLSSAEIQTGDDKAALRNAQRAVKHGAGASGYILESQAYLELNQTELAIQAARSAVQSSTNDQTAQLQLGLSYAVATNHDKLAQIIGLLGSSEAATKLSSALESNTALAQELYVLGLLRSSQRILAKYPVESSQSYLLQARIILQLGSNNQKTLQEGRGLLQKAVALSPERVDTRQLLQSVDNKLGDTAAAGEQGSRIKAIEEGRV